MKRIMIVFAATILAVALQAQSLEEIVKKNSVAMKSDKMESINTARITGKVSQMGMEMPITMVMKRPNKVKVSTSMNGMEIIQMFDGQKGYMLNPFAGSSEMTELPVEQAKQIERNNLFVNQLKQSMADGNLELAGEEVIDGKPAFKLKMVIDGVDNAFMFISKETFLPVMTRVTVTQMGNQVEVELYTMEFTDFNGLFLPKRTVTYAGGMEVASLIYEKVEVNVPVDDSEFMKK